MNYDEKEADRYYVISGVLRDMGFRGAGDYWFSERGFGPYGFDFLASAPAVRDRLRRLRYERNRASSVLALKKARPGHLSPPPKDTGEGRA